jgi:hypothetical protein
MGFRDGQQVLKLPEGKGDRMIRHDSYYLSHSSKGYIWNDQGGMGITGAEATDRPT